MQKECSFAIEDIESVPFSDYDEDEYAVARMRFISDKPNSHGIVISKDVLMESAKSVLGAWVIADVEFGDATTHTSTQNIYGYFPKDQEVKFEETDDGYTYAVADAVISKRYGKDYYNIFTKDNHRSVSVEATFAFEDEDSDIAVAFSVKAVTTLGKTVNPSVPGADTEIIRFSEQEAESFYKKISLESLSAKVDKIYKKLGIDSDGKEEQKMEIEFAAVKVQDMLDAVGHAIYEKGWQYYIEGFYEEDGKKFAIVKDCEEPDKRYRLDFSYTEDGVTLAEETVEVKTEFVETENIKKFAMPDDDKSEEKEEKPDDSEEEEKEEKDEDMSEESDSEMACKKLQDSVDELSRQVEEKENIIMDKDKTIAEMQVKLSEQEAELSTLREYKKTVMAKENAHAVDALMSEVKPFIDAEKFAEFKEEGLTCTEENFDAWKNKVQAVCFANVSKKLKKDDLGVFTFAAPIEEKRNENKSVWDRIKENNL